MSPLKHSKGFAARMGRWSASHWKTATFGWLAFVIVAFAVGIAVPMQMIDQKDAAVGEAGKANKIIDDAFDLTKNGQGELVIIQSKTKTVDDPAFRATINDTIGALSSFEQVDKLHSPLAAGNEGQISPDRHSALIIFSPHGTYDEAVLYIDSIVAATAGVQKAHPDFYVAEAGVSTGKALDKVINGGVAKVGLIALVLTFVILLLVVGSAVSAVVPILVGLTAVFATFGLVSLPSKLVPMDGSVNEVILLIGIAVGVDYSLFYLRRVRDERRAGRSERASIEAAAATSGRAVLISGITVIIAMAGMLLSGDKTFMSFAIGTMMVVGIAMIGSLTVLPAMLSKLGDRVEKGRIPFLHRLRRDNGDGSRFWSAILKPVLRHPVISAIASAAVLVVLALPALHLHTADSGLDALPKSQPELKSFHAIDDAFPGGATGAVVAIKGKDSVQLRSAIADLKAKALASGEMQNPIRIDKSPDGSAYEVDISLAGNGTNAVSNHALATLRGELLPATVGTVPGVEYAVGGPHCQVARLQRDDEVVGPPRVRLRPAVRVPAPAGRLPLDRDRTQGDRAQPALGCGGLRDARRDLPVGLGREPARLQLDGRHRLLAADVPVRDPVRALDGLPRVHPEPDPRSVRPRSRYFGRRRARHPHDRRRRHRRLDRHGRRVRDLRDPAAARPQGDGDWPCPRRSSSTPPSSGQSCCPRR